MIARVAAPVSMMIAGPLADEVFEPSMTKGGYLASVFGGAIGTESGTGMAFMFVMTGVIAMVVCLIGYSLPYIRDAEDILPDHDAVDSPADD